MLCCLKDTARVSAKGLAGGGLVAYAAAEAIIWRKYMKVLRDRPVWLKTAAPGGSVTMTI